MDIRLHKYLADAGVASRRKAEAFMRAGRVSVNGETVYTPGAKADPDRDVIALDGRPVTADAADKTRVYLLLHKPAGVVTSVSDPQGRPVVMDYVADVKARVYPVGRLDYDTSGLLLLTNDGALAHALTHPRHGVPKTYEARLRGTPNPEALARFRRGLRIEGRLTAPCEIRLLQDGRGKKTGSGQSLDATARIVLREGRNRQVRKMCAAIGHPVTALRRVAIGSLTLGDLPVGAYRALSAEEVAALYHEQGESV